MTNLGKRLVFINLTLSLLFLAWAIGLYTNHVNWSTPPSDGGQRVQGMVDELKAEITKLVAARDAANVRWGEATNRVLALEAERPARQRYYADLIRSARSGDVADIAPPVQQLAYLPNGALDFRKRSGRAPVAFDGQPALSVAGNHAAKLEKAGQITTAQNQVTALIGETEMLTRQMIGVDAPGGGERVTAEQKGLRALLAEQQKLAHDLRLEQEYLRSPLTNLTIETHLLQKRQTALDARLRELQRATTALGRGPG